MSVFFFSFSDMIGSEHHTIFLNTNYKFGNSYCERISSKQRIFEWAEPIIDYKEFHQMLAAVWHTNVEIDGIATFPDSTFDNSNIGVLEKVLAENSQSSKK